MTKKPLPKKHKLYLTEYNVDFKLTFGFKKGLYGSKIWATSKKQAISLARRRGIGERVIGLSIAQDPDIPTSQVLSLASPQEVLHSLIWLSFLALKSKVATVDDIFSDSGILHLYIHRELMIDMLDPKNALVEAVLVLESKIPGYGPMVKGKSCGASNSEGVGSSPTGTTKAEAWL